MNQLLTYGFPAAVEAWNFPYEDDCLKELFEPEHASEHESQDDADEPRIDFNRRMSVEANMEGLSDEVLETLRFYRVKKHPWRSTWVRTIILYRSSGLRF